MDAVAGERQIRGGIVYVVRSCASGQLRLATKKKRYLKKANIPSPLSKLNTSHGVRARVFPKRRWTVWKIRKKTAKVQV